MGSREAKFLTLKGHGKGEFVVLTADDGSENNGCGDFMIDREDFRVLAEMVGRSEDELRRFLQEFRRRGLIYVKSDDNDRRIVKIKMLYFVTLPPTLGRLESLIHLEISSSGITTVPPSIGQLRNLRFLILKSTYELEELPNEIGDLANLNTLVLNQNRIKSKIETVKLFFIVCKILLPF